VDQFVWFEWASAPDRFLEDLSDDFVGPLGLVESNGGPSIPGGTDLGPEDGREIMMSRSNVEELR